MLNECPDPIRIERKAVEESEPLYIMNTYSVTYNWFIEEIAVKGTRRQAANEHFV